MIYVDEIRNFPHARGKYKKGACHLMGDTLSELHAFAERIGCKPSWYHGKARHPHYDLTEKWRLKAIEAGAVPMSTREILKRRRASAPSPGTASSPSEDPSSLPPSP